MNSFYLFWVIVKTIVGDPERHNHLVPPPLTSLSFGFGTFLPLINFDTSLPQFLSSSSSLTGISKFDTKGYAPKQTRNKEKEWKCGKQKSTQKKSIFLKSERKRYTEKFKINSRR